jgi:hypothetical protein
MREIWLDVALTVVTLIVAIIGVTWDKPTFRIKVLLVVLAIVASGGAIFKIAKDQSDKKFFEHALISTLAPSNSEYQKMEQEIYALADKRTFNDGPCHHSNDGLICLLFKMNNTSAHATLVFNHDEVAKMYANSLANKTNARFINDAFDKVYDRSQWNEGFVDKVGVLGMAVCFNMFHHCCPS